MAIFIATVSGGFEDVATGEIEQTDARMLDRGAFQGCSRDSRPLSLATAHVPVAECRVL